MLNASLFADLVFDDELTIFQRHVKGKGIGLRQLIMLHGILKGYKGGDRGNQKFLFKGAVKFLFDLKCVTKTEFKKLGIFVYKDEFIFKQNEVVILNRRGYSVS